MAITTHLPGRLRAAVERELAPDERIVWMEMPVARFFTPKATATMLFGIPWIAFCLFFLYEVSGIDGPERTGISNVALLLSAPFLLIGVFMLLAPLLSHYMARNSAYVITERRAVTFDYLWGMTVRSYTPDKLKNVFRREGRNGLGDVVIAHEDWTDMDGDRRREDLGFKDVRDAKHAEELLKQLASRAT